MTFISLDYYKHSDVLYLSQDLLGKYLFTFLDGHITGGMIVETEAYRGPEDQASHAYNNRKTKRNEVMYQAGGIAYVYMCYGIHSLFNIVTNYENIPHAILIRSIEPIVGIEMMLKRRKKQKLIKTLTQGPGALSSALGITTALNGKSLLGPEVWLEDRGFNVPVQDIIAGPRVGVEYAKDDAKLPWRFKLANNPWSP